MTGLGRWFSEHQDSSWLIAEQACCALLLSQSVAGHAVQFELTPEVPEFLCDSPAVFHHHFQVDPNGNLDGACRGRVNELPLASNSVQLLVSHHSHETGHQLGARLEEWSRVLVANGTVVLISFNPLGRSCDAPTENLQCLRPGQVSKRLRAVGLVPQRSRALLLPETSRSDRTLERAQQLWPATESWVASLAPGYVMLAQKVDSYGGAMKLRRLQLDPIKQGVQGTATG